MSSPLAIGCMRLSAAEVNEQQADDVIAAALEAGVRWFDTADVYAPDHTAIGHNERLLAAALKRHAAGREDVTVSTKGGLTRPIRGPWRQDGRARHLYEACERSLRALDRAALDMYLLHAVDRRVPLATSVRALDNLRRRGLVRCIGLCNVNVTQLQEARQLTVIDAVQVSLGPYDAMALYGGMVEYCQQHGIILMAHTPLGGEAGSRRLSRSPTLRAITQRLGISAQQLALAWLRSLGDQLMPLPGPTRRPTAASLATLPQLSSRDRERLDARFPAGRLARSRRAERAVKATAPLEESGEVVLLMGIPGAGKSAAAAAYVERGYQRLNRDVLGGKLNALVKPLEEGLAGGRRHWVLDNTYRDRQARARVAEVAFRHGVPVRCVQLDTPLHEAQINVVGRLLARHGFVPDQPAWRALKKTDPQAFGPGTLFRYLRQQELPQPDEGFHTIDQRPFVRQPSQHDGRAVWVQLESLRASVSGKRSPQGAQDLLVHRARAAALRAKHQQGFRLIAFGWQPEVARGGLTLEQVEEVNALTVAALDVPLLTTVCPHGAGQPRCWCRPPLPGLVVPLLQTQRLDARRCILVGDSAADRTLAERFGMTHFTTEAFFGAGSV